MLARMWTRGWDVYAPGCQVLFHQWERSSRASTYQSDAVSEPGPTERYSRREQSQAKVRAVLGAGRWPRTDPCDIDGRTHQEGLGGLGRAPISGTDGGAPNGDQDVQDEALGVPSAWQPGGVWGLGEYRLLRDFQKQSGVDFKAGQMEARAVWGGLDPSCFDT
eukprot:gene21622-28625_t